MAQQVHLKVDLLVLVNHLGSTLQSEQHLSLQEVLKELVQLASLLVALLPLKIWQIACEEAKVSPNLLEKEQLKAEALKVVKAVAVLQLNVNLNLLQSLSAR